MLLFAAAASVASAQQPPDPKAEWPKKWETLAKKAAREHVTLGKAAAGKKLFEAGYKQYLRACELDPVGQDAQKALGRKYEGGVWVDDPKAAVKKKNEVPATEIEAVLADFESKKRAAYQKLVPDFETLGAWADKAGLKDEAKGVWRQILDVYDSENEKARLAFGWVKVDGRWVSPEDMAKRDAGAKKVAGASEGKPVTDPSDVENRCGFKLVKRRSDHFFLEGMVTDAEMIELIKASEGARTAFLETFDLPADALATEIHGVFLNTPEDYGVYVDHDPGVPDRDKKSWKSFSGYPRWQPPGFVTYKGPRDFNFFKDDAVHMAVHILFWEFSGLSEIPAFIYEGLSYWFTDRLLKSALTYCIALESSAGGGRGFDNILDWKGLIKGSLNDGSDPELREVMEGSLNSLNMKRAVKSWSVIDYMLTTRKKDFLEYIAQLKSGAVREEAMKKAFGVGSYGELDALWEKWVKATY